MQPPHSNEANRGRSHRSRSRSHSKRHRANCCVSSKHHDQSNKSIAQPSPPTFLLRLPPGVLLPEDMHPDSILTNPVIAELLHSLSPIQIKHSLDEFCNENRSKQGIVRNVIGDLDEFLKRYIKNKRLSPVARETSVVPATSAPIDSICERTAEELSVIPFNLIREKEEAIVLRALDQLCEVKCDVEREYFRWQLFGQLKCTIQSRAFSVRNSVSESSDSFCDM